VEATLWGAEASEARHRFSPGSLNALFSVVSTRDNRYEYGTGSGSDRVQLATSDPLEQESWLGLISVFFFSR